MPMNILFLHLDERAVHHDKGKTVPVAQEP